jgi:hypothetical protein
MDPDFIPEMLLGGKISKTQIHGENGMIGYGRKNPNISRHNIHKKKKR